MSRKNKLIAATAMSAALLTGGAVGAALGVPGVTLAQDSGTATTAAADPTAPSPDANVEGHRHHGRRLGDGVVMAAAAEVLGMSQEDLRAELAEGKSLADLAEVKGVERQALVDAMVAAAEKRLEEAKAKLPERMDQLVDHTFDGTGPGDHGDRFPRIGHGIEAAADVLGMTEEDLKSALRDGKSLADIAEEKGVERQALLDAMLADAKERLAEKVADGTITQEQADRRLEMATKAIERIIDGQRPFPDRPGRPGRPGGPRGETTADSTAGGN